MDINNLDFFKSNVRQTLTAMIQGGYWRHQLFNRLNKDEVRAVEEISTELNAKSIFQLTRNKGGNCYVYW